MNSVSNWCKLTAATAALVALPAAASYNVSFSGTYDATAPVTSFSTPGASWSVSFDIEPHPVPLAALPDGVKDGSYTTVPFSNFSYQLEGAASAQAQYVVLYSASNEGGMTVFFSDVFHTDPVVYEALELFGSQIYGGPESSPTMVPGLYPTFIPGRSYGVVIASNATLYPQGNTVIAVVPEPASGLLLLAGAVSVAWVVRRRKEPAVA